MIKAFAQARRVRPENFPAFRQNILDGLGMLGQDKQRIDMEKYKVIAGQGGGRMIDPEDKCQYQGCGNPISSYRCENCGKFCCFNHSRFRDLVVISCACCDETLR